MPRGNGPAGGGMGNPHEPDYFYRGLHDAPSAPPPPRRPPPQEVVLDPEKALSWTAPPGLQRYFDHFYARLRDEMRSMVFLTKRPSFAEPPFWAKPRIVFGDKTVPAGAPGAETVIWERDLTDRHKLVIGSVGINVDPPALFGDADILFWFEVGGKVVPIFDDQTPGTLSKTLFIQGKTAFVPGTCNDPFLLLAVGTPLVVRGPANVAFKAQNYNAATAATICGLSTYWLYRTPKAGEHEEADLQV